MATASLQLLKSKKSAAAAPPETVAEEAPAPEPEVEETSQADGAQVSGEEEITVDVDTMTGPELDALVNDNEIAVPTAWWKQENGVKKMTVPEKKAWLKEQFEDAGTEAAALAEEAPAPEPAPEPAPAPAASKAVAKASGKAVGKAAKSGEVLEADEFSDMVHEIENLTGKAARELVRNLADTAEFTYFKLGGVLSVIQSNSWFEPYASFREYVEQEHGILYRRAMYYISIYNELTEAKIPWPQVKHLGWTKLKEIAEILTLENMVEWIKVAEKQTALQLIETVKAAKAAANPGKGTEALADGSASVTVTTKTFKVHDDQKATIEAAIEKAKEVAGTTVDTVALEFICLDFIGGKKTATKTDPKALLKKLGLDAALEAFSEAFPDVTLVAEMPE